jgi:hypothetical protein
MTKAELKRRLKTFQTRHALEEITISEHDPVTFRVVLTFKQNVTISERLIRQLEQALGEPLRSLSLLGSGAAVLRFTVPRSAAGNETDSERVQETIPAFYGGRSARTGRSQYLLAQRLIASTSGDATSEAYVSTDARSRDNHLCTSNNQVHSIQGR